MNGLSVIIPSKTTSNLIACVDAVRRHENHGVRLIVVDDGVDWSEVGPCRYVGQGLEVYDGIKPFVFARNMNIGIQAAGEDDVVLLNDDALLETPGGFALMQSIADDHESIGLISATTNVAGNPEQHRRRGPRTRFRILSRPTPGNSFPTVAFVCVLIPRRTIQVVGLLDDRFGGTTPEGKQIYGFDDSDYCRRVQLAGLQIAVSDGCYVDHASLVSAFRGAPHAAGDIEPARRIYLDKWGKM